MPSIFPGMDPYLEAHWIWPTFHNSLADQIQMMLNEQLPKNYFAQLEARSELGIRASKKWIIAPDVAVMQSGWKPRPGARVDEGGLAVAVEEAQTISKAIRIEFIREPVTVTAVAIRSTNTGNEVVTLIEILSPANKRPGTDRDHYKNRMQEILDATTTSLVEIDLLRKGERTWEESEIIEEYLCELENSTEYLVMTSRAWSRCGADMYPVSIVQPLPTIAIPLREDESDVPLNLQTAFNRTYDGGPYRRGAIDYTKPPNPALNDEQELWRTKLMNAWASSAESEHRRIV